MTAGQCNHRGPHPAHKWMFARKRQECEGVPDTSPTPVEAVLRKHMMQPKGSPWYAEVEADLRAAGLLARTSMGPDSERIRELEAENARLRKHVNAIPCGLWQIHSGHHYPLGGGRYADCPGRTTTARSKAEAKGRADD